MIGALLKALRKLNPNTFLPFVAGLVTVICIGCTSLVTHAVDLPSGNSGTSVTGNGFTVNAQNLSITASGDGQQLVTVDGDAYRGWILWEGTYYLTYSWSVSGAGSTLQYHTGYLLFTDAINATYTTSTGWTVDRAGYTISVVDQSEGFSLGFTSGTSGSYQFAITYDDLYLNANNKYYITVCVHVSGRSVRATGDFNLIYPPNISIKHSITINGPSGDVGSGDSKLHDEVYNALEDSLTLASMESSLGYIHTDLGLIYDRMASFIAQESSYDAALANQLNSLLIGSYTEDNTQYSAGVGTLVGKLLTLFGSKSQQVTDANNEISSSASSEQSAMNQANNIISSINVAADMNYDQSIAKISSIGTNNVFNLMATPIKFWHDVTKWILDIDNLGYLSWALLMMLVISFTVWILAL